MDGSFFPSQFRSHSVPNKHTEACINYKLYGLLFRLISNYLLQLKLTRKSFPKYIELKQQESLIITLPDYKERKLQNIILLPTLSL